jgi:hypothetical protein
VLLGSVGANTVNHGYISSGISGYRLLDKSEEKFAAAFRSTAVEAERELVQIVAQVRVADGALVRTHQLSFQ